MANDVQEAVGQILARIRAMPARVETAVKVLEETLEKISYELKSAEGLADKIISDATANARNLQTKTKALDQAFKIAAAEIGKL